MREMKKPDSKNRNLNQVLETFISMKSETECNETAFAISFDRFHEVFMIFKKMTSNYNQNCFEFNINRRIRKETKTDVESATFETLEVTVDLAVLI